MDIETKIYTYKEVYTGYLKLYADGSVQRSEREWPHHVLGTINKMACVNVTNDWDLVSMLAQDTENPTISPGSTIYVASECKTGRDTFRNSGYSITRSPDKADAIVVPDVNAKSFYSVTGLSLVAYDPEKDELHLYSVSKPGYLVSQLTDTDLVSLRKYVRDKGFEPLEVNREKITVWFIPKCDEIRDILEKRIIPNKPYIQESKVPIKASTQISPETLMFWENIDDPNLLTRTICTSDWMDYPVTLYVFLVYFKQAQNSSTNWYGYANNDFRRILKSIGYEGYVNMDWALNAERMISPKDYEMLQSYLMMHLGLDENGGFISSSAFAKIHKCLRPFLRQRVAVKPMTIPAKMRLEDLYKLATS